MLELLLNDIELYDDLVHNAKIQVNQDHNIETERQAYQTILDQHMASEADNVHI